MRRTERSSWPCWATTAYATTTAPWASGPTATTRHWSWRRRAEEYVIRRNALLCNHESQTSAMKKGIVVAVIGGTIVAVVDAGFCLSSLNWPSLRRENSFVGLERGVVGRRYAGIFSSDAWLDNCGYGPARATWSHCSWKYAQKGSPNGLRASIPQLHRRHADGAKWRWRWSGNRIARSLVLLSELVMPNWFMRSICHQRASYVNAVPRMAPFGPYGGERGRTVTTIMGGGRQYAVGATEREILRRIRTGER